MREKALVVSVFDYAWLYNHLCRYVHVGGVEWVFCCMSLCVSVCVRLKHVCVCLLTAVLCSDCWMTAKC